MWNQIRPVKVAGHHILPTDFQSNFGTSTCSRRSHGYILTQSGTPVTSSMYMFKLCAKRVKRNSAYISTASQMWIPSLLRVYLPYFHQHKALRMESRILLPRVHRIFAKPLSPLSCSNPFLLQTPFTIHLRFIHLYEARLLS